MSEIICPNCHKAFRIDEAGYADIVKQVRDEEFEKVLHERLTLAELDKENAVKLAEMKIASKLEKEAATKDLEIERLREELKFSAELVHSKVASEMKDEVVKKDAEIERLKAMGGDMPSDPLGCGRLSS